MRDRRDLVMRLGSRGAFRRFRVSALFRRLETSIGVLLLAALILMTAVGSVFYDSTATLANYVPLLPPGTAGHLLGTDGAGRDLLASILVGGRLTMLVGLAAAAITTTIGVMLGGVAGYFGGWIDSMIMRLTELFQVLPPILFAMLIVMLFEPSFGSIVASIAAVIWPATMRVTRGEFLRLRGLDYVKAARSFSASNRAIMLKILLPNALPSIIIISTLTVGSAMLFEAGLSFLGLANPNAMSWGLLLGENRTVILLAWWPVALPGLAIFLAVLAVCLIGDGLSDATSPRTELL